MSIEDRCANRDSTPKEKENLEPKPLELRSSKKKERFTSENQMPEDSEFLKHNTDGHGICLECAADL